MARARLGRHGRSQRCDQSAGWSHLRATVAAAERRRRGGSTRRRSAPRLGRLRHARGAACCRCVSTRPLGLALNQKAPGGSRGTPGHSPPRSPCAAGLHEGITCRGTAWTAGWFSHPESPGFHPGLLVTRANVTKSPRRKPGDTGWQAFPFAMWCGFVPGHCVPSSGMDGGVVFTPGVPGFPPGASWSRDETDSLAAGRGNRGRMPRVSVRHARGLRPLRAGRP